MEKIIKITIILIFILGFIFQCKSTPKQENAEAPIKEQVQENALDINSVNNILSNLTADNFITNRTQYSTSVYKKWEKKFLAANIINYLKNDIPKGYSLLLTGHADITGTSSRNEKVSKGRAQYLKNKLRSLGLSQKIVSITWKSNRELIDRNEPESGLNRRVELRLVKK